MSVATVSLFYALLALAANAFVLAVIGVGIAARRSRRASAALAHVEAALAPSGLGAAFAVALLATLGSLYFSEVAHFEPCRLCWYQRIAMYPLVVLLGLAALRRDLAVRPYAIALAGMGAAIAAYHVASSGSRRWNRVPARLVSRARWSGSVSSASSACPTLRCRHSC